jgi:hypothetical protein
MNTINIRPFRPEDAEALAKAAALDGHTVYCPSFVLEKNGEIVGYYSAVVPMVLSWQDSKKMNALDSIKELGHIEGSLCNSPFIAIPCDLESPYMKFLPKQGYENYFKPVTLFIKRR